MVDLDLTFNVVLAVAALVGIFTCLRRERQLRASNEDLRSVHDELLGEIQHVLATVSADIDRLQGLIPEEQAPEGRRITQDLVRAIDEIILITRGDLEA